MSEKNLATLKLYFKALACGDDHKLLRVVAKELDLGLTLAVEDGKDTVTFHGSKLMMRLLAERLAELGGMVKVKTDLQTILDDPEQRRELMMNTIIATQARAGITTTRSQAAAAYDKILGERE